MPSSELLEHPAVIAWSELRPERIEPREIQALQMKKKSAVYRLEGVGNGGTALIAEWSPGIVRPGTSVTTAEALVLSRPDGPR